MTEESKDSTKTKRRTYNTVTIGTIDPNYDPYEHRDQSYSINDCLAVIHLIKGCMGTGILAMPVAFKHVGLLYGIITTLICGLVVSHGMEIIANCARLLCYRANLPYLDYGGVAEVGFKLGPEKYKKLSNTMKILSDVFMCINGFGSCTIYIIFVTENIKQVIDYYTDTDINLRFYMLGLLPIVLLIIYIRELKYLAPFSLLANFCILFAIVACFYFIFIDLPEFSKPTKITTPLEWPYFLAVCVFAISGISVTLPIENQMKTPRHLTSYPGVLCFGMSFVILLYALLGFFGYWRYGNNIEDSITLNLPEDHILAQLVKISISTSTAVTYSLQYYVGFEIVWFKNLANCYSDNHFLFHEYGWRTFICFATFALAIAIPTLGGFIGLIGSISLSNLTLILPGLIEMAVYWNDPGMGKFHWRLIKDIFMIIFGIFVFFIGSYTSVDKMIQDWK